MMESVIVEICVSVTDVPPSRFDVVAEMPADDEREELWRRLHEFYAGWSHYQTLTDRQLPIIRLRPQSGPAREAGPTTEPPARRD